MANGRGKPRFKTEQEFEQRLIEVARVTRVMAGGKRMRFRATLVIGDKKGRVGAGVAKGADVTMAIQKAFNQAKKNMVEVPIIDGTIPHEMRVKYGAAEILLKPAVAGSGIKAGGAVRIILEMAGLQDVSAKIMGTNNKLNNVKAIMKALTEFKMTDEMRKKVKPIRKDRPQEERSERPRRERPGRRGGVKSDVKKEARATAETKTREAVKANIKPRT